MNAIVSAAAATLTAMAIAIYTSPSGPRPSPRLCWAATRATLLAWGTTIILITMKLLLQ